MSGSLVAVSALNTGKVSTNPPMQGSSVFKIHTIDDWQQTSTANARELTELLGQTMVLMNSAKEAAERYSNCIASNGVSLRNIIERTQAQEDGQPELALKIELADKNTAETRRQIVEAKKASFHALVAAGTFGASIVLRTMPVSSRSEQNAPNSSGQSLNQSKRAPLSDTRVQDRSPNIDSPQQKKSDSVLGIVRK